VKNNDHIPVKVLTNTEYNLHAGSNPFSGHNKQYLIKQLTTMLEIKKSKDQTTACREMVAEAPTLQVVTS
jgi:hypothetical protein